MSSAGSVSLFFCDVLTGWAPARNRNPTRARTDVGTFWHAFITLCSWRRGSVSPGAHSCVSHSASRRICDRRLWIVLLEGVLVGGRPRSWSWQEAASATPPPCSSLTLSRCRRCESLFFALRTAASSIRCPQVADAPRSCVSPGRGSPHGARLWSRPKKNSGGRNSKSFSLNSVGLHFSPSCFRHPALSSVASPTEQDGVRVGPGPGPTLLLIFSRAPALRSSTEGSPGSGQARPGTRGEEATGTRP